MARRTFPSKTWASRALVTLSLMTAVIGIITCEDSPTDAGRVSAPASPAESNDPEEEGRSLTAASVPLPFSGAVTANKAAFKIEQKGAGNSGYFKITNTGNAKEALLAETNSTVFFSSAITALATGVGGDTPAIRAEVTTASNEGDGIFARTVGTGNAVIGVQRGSAGTAGYFSLEHSSNASPALVGSTIGPGTALLVLKQNSSGTGLDVLHTGPSGNIAIFRTSTGNKARIDRTGRGFFNGGTQIGGADVAEALAVEGSPARYRPGDVLVVSTRSDARVTMTSEPYSTRVAGVYATRPGVLLTERPIDVSLEDLVPVGVVGILPTRVSAENGAIWRGDLLVTATRRGHAMRARPVVVNGVRLYPTGAILGKALEEFRGPGTGMIRVLVNVR